MKSRKIVFIIIGLILLSLIGWYLYKSYQPKPKPDTSLTVKIGYLTLVQSLPHFVAVEKGFYNEEGLNVESSNISSSNQIAQDLVAGHLDVAINFSIVPLLQQYENAPNTALIYNSNLIDQNISMDGVLVKGDSKITKLEDLSGKKVGVFPGTTAKRMFASVFQTKFPKLQLPTLVELPPNLQNQSLANGDIDSLFAYEPNLTMGLIKNNFKKIHSSIFTDFYSPNPMGVGAVNSKWLNTNPDAAKKFFNAIDKANRFIDQNPGEARQFLTQYLKLDPDVANKVTFIKLTDYKNFDYAMFNGFFKKLSEIGEIKSYPEAQTICVRP